MSNRIIVAGSRDFQDYSFFEQNMNSILRNYTDIEIVSGHARGADRMGEYYAKTHGIPVSVFPAQWDKYGKSAGFRRNEEMLKYAQQQTPILIAFWDGQSRGTAGMIQIARRSGATVHVVRYK